MKKTNKLFIALCLALIACLAAPALLPAGLNPAFTARAAAALNKRKATLYTGKTLQLKVTGATKGVKWSSSRPKVAKVDQKGLVTALKAGKATITAKVDGKKLTCAITVKQSLSADATNITLKAGETKTVNLTSRSGGSLSLKAYNSTLLECRLGAVRGGKCALTVKGLRAGSQTLVVTNTKTGEAVKIRVTVRESGSGDSIVDRTEVTVRVGRTAQVKVSKPLPMSYVYEGEGQVMECAFANNGYPVDNYWIVEIKALNPGTGRLWFYEGSDPTQNIVAEVRVTVK